MIQAAKIIGTRLAKNEAISLALVGQQRSFSASTSLLMPNPFERYIDSDEASSSSSDQPMESNEASSNDQPMEGIEASYSDQSMSEYEERLSYDEIRAKQYYWNSLEKNVALEDKNKLLGEIARDDQKIAYELRQEQSMFDSRIRRSDISIERKRA